MTCRKCGSACQGRRCADCRDIAAAEAAVADTETYPCPTCGEPSSGPETECYRCRGGGE